jgi:CHAT domain-containing protein
VILAAGERLTASDLYRDYRVARMAVLSGCETAIAGPMHSDETISAPAALLAAGYAGAIGSLWTVSDVSTAILMIKFYEEWFDIGGSPAAALRRAQLWLSSASRADLVEYFSPHAMPWYSERLSAKRRQSLQQAWALIRDGVSNTAGNERPYEDPVFWASFCAYGV